MRKLFIILLLLSTPAVAGIFGPSNYDECVLEKIDKMKSNESVKALQQACRGQFPSGNEKTITEKIWGTDKERLLKKCHISEKSDYTASTAFLTVLPLGNRSQLFRNKVQEAINKLDNTKWIGGYYPPTFSFVNGNQFGISGLAIGIKKKENKNSVCSTNKEDYDAVSFCGVPDYQAEKGVGQMQYGEFRCDETVAKFKNQSTCVVGYRPAINYFEYGLARFLDKQGMCE
jgi:hypothetical protein